MQQNNVKQKIKRSKRNREIQLFSFVYEIPKDNLKPGFFQSLRLYIANNFTILNTPSVSQIEFETKHVFYIPYKATIKLYHESDYLDMTIGFQARNFINISIAIILFSAFFSRFSLGLYFWFSLFFVAAFYIIHLILFANMCKKIKNVISVNSELDDVLSSEQQVWMQHPHLCSGCGNTISEYDQNCSECGLFIKKGPAFPRYSATENIKVVYKYNESNEKD